MARTISYGDVNPYAAPVSVLLIGGPVHGRRTGLSRQQVENGYEFVDAGTSFAKTNESPHSHWRSAKYRKLTTINDITVMVHESVTEPGAWRFAEELTNARDDLSKAADRLEQLNKEIGAVEGNLALARDEKASLEHKLTRVKKFNALAKAMLEEVEDE